MNAHPISSRGSIAPPNPVTPENVTAEGTPIALPPHLFQPRGAPTIHQEGRALIAPLATAPLITIEPGAGNDLVIAKLGFGANDPTALTNATFSILQSGNPVQGYGSMTISIGSIDQPSDVFILVPGPSPVTVVITNNFPGNTWTYLARLVGWTLQLAVRNP